MKPISLLIVDDEEVIVKLFERIARQEKWSCVALHSGYEALDFLTKNEVECVVLDLHLPTVSGFEVLNVVKSTKPATEVVIITGSGSVEQAVQTLKQGAYDYLAKPFGDMAKVVATLRNALEKHRLVKKVQELQRVGEYKEDFLGIIGRSKVMQELYHLIDSLKDSSSSVLIEGESGTGKEMVAKAIHRSSKRAMRPFSVINCAAIPEGLLESELFGHAKGAFTGAIADKVGLFEEADGGTLFLDEIGEVSPAFQVKLLRVLQSGDFKRVGDGSPRHTDVRVIAATNKELKTMIQEGKFREDLYYRLHVIGIHLPALRERKEDIPLLVYHFLKKYNAKLEKNIREFSVEAMEALQSYPWVGNVRELENVIERTVVLTQDDVIRAKDLPIQVLSHTFYLGHSEQESLGRLSYREAKDRAVAMFNKSYLHHLLKQTRGNISVASDRAGMDRSNFKKIIRKYEINIREFKKG